MTPSEILAEAGRRGLRLAMKGQDKISVRPGDALTEDMKRLILAHRDEILALLRQGWSQPAEAPRPAHDPACPWPTSLPGYGPKTLGPLTHCLLCRAATWVRFGLLPVCLACARKFPGPPDPKTRLSSLLTTWYSMNETAWGQGDVDTIKNMTLDIFRDCPEANAWFRAWRAAHPAAKLA